jgi:EAL domain-containing protein (putative c-di-GMP-specific phosphodiesterase class I)
MIMANNLNLEVTAEGVEMHSQLHFLKQHKCHYFQGYLYSPPVPAEKFKNILDAEKQRSTV